MIALRRVSLAYIWRMPLHTSLAVAGIAVGVATFVAIEQAKSQISDALSTAVVRLAGRADLQITATSGVPEMQEQLRTIPQVEAALPVIEQVTQPVDARLGSILVIGVDLVGDHQIRDYGFETAGVDVDDPLSFLAQPDSIAISRELADRAGLAEGSPLALHLGDSSHTLTVRALLPQQSLTQAYGGNVAIMDVYAAQTLFGRGRTFDRFELRLAPGVSADSGAVAVTSAIGREYRVEPPSRRSGELQRLAGSVLRGFDVISTLATAVGVFLVCNVFTIAVSRRWRDIAVLRAVGATPGQVTGLFLAEAVVLGLAGSAIGVGLGVVAAARVTRIIAVVLAMTEGMAPVGEAALSLGFAVRGVVVGALASLAGAWIPARRAATLAPSDALTIDAVDSASESRMPWLAASGLGLTIGAVLLGWLDPFPRIRIAPAVTLVGALGVTLFAGYSCRMLFAPLLPLLPRLTRAPGRIAADALRQPRRTTSTAATLAVCAAFVLGTGGFLLSVSRSFDGWLTNVMTADIVVRAAPGWGASASKLPYDTVRPVIAARPEVLAIDAVREERVDYRGIAVTVMAVEARPFLARTHHDVIAGDISQLAREGQSEPVCLISTSLASRSGLAAGDVLTVRTPTGDVGMRVAAVVAGDRSAVTIDRSVFTARWRDDRVDTINLGLRPGTNAGDLRQRLRVDLSSLVPALVVVRAEFVEQIRQSLSVIYLLIRATTMLMLTAAFLAIALAQSVVVHDRQRDIGVLRAIGALPSQISAAAVIESLVIAGASLLLAVPLGSLLAWFLRARVSETIAGYHFGSAYPVNTLLVLIVGLPVVGVLATWLPSRWLAERRPVDTLIDA